LSGVGPGVHALAQVVPDEYALPGTPLSTSGPSSPMCSDRRPRRIVTGTVSGRLGARHQNTRLDQEEPSSLVRVTVPTGTGLCRSPPSTARVADAERRPDAATGRSHTATESAVCLGSSTGRGSCAPVSPSGCSAGSSQKVRRPRWARSAGTHPPPIPR
jgi:hypothetical protein